MKNEAMTLTLGPLKANNSGDVADLQRVLDGAPAYSYLVNGRPPLPTDAEDIFNDLPVGLSASDKLVTALLFNRKIVGFIDVCKGYPEAYIAYIGLLLIAERFQGRGFGCAALIHIRNLARSWNCRAIRVAVLENNLRALTFWRKEGFAQLYQKTVKGYIGDVIIMESQVDLLS